MATMIMSSLNLTKDNAQSGPSVLTTKTNQLHSIYSKVLKTVATFPHNGNSIRQFKELMSFQNSSSSSSNSSTENSSQYSGSSKKIENNQNQQKQKIQDLKESKFLQDKTKDIKVITRNDLLYNTYDLEYKSASSQKINKTSSHHHNRQHRQKKVKSSPNIHKRESSIEPEKLRRNNTVSFADSIRPQTPAISIDHIDSIDDDDIIPFVPDDHLIKNELVFLENKFTDSGLLSIPIYKTITRESEISDYRSS